MSGNFNVNYYGQQGYVPQYVPRAAYQGPVSYPHFGNTQEYDSFESSSGGGMGSAVTYGAIGATGAGATGYFLFGNPIAEMEDGLKVNERFYQALDEARFQEALGKNIKAAELEKLKAVGINSKEELEALRKLAKAESLDALSEEARRVLPASVTTPEAAKELVLKAEAEIVKIDKSAIVKTTKESLADISYKTFYEQTKNYTSLEEGIAKLGKDATPENLKQFITENKKLFGIAGDEAAVSAELERLSKLGQEGLLTEVQNCKKILQTGIDTVDSHILSNYSKESKAFLEEAPEILKNAAKEFKWSQAKRFGLWGAGIAAGAYLITSLFSGGKKQS